MNFWFCVPVSRRWIVSPRPIASNRQADDVAAIFGALFLESRQSMPGEGIVKINALSIMVQKDE
jgi:hypothetical protein